MNGFPSTASARDRYVLQRRAPRPVHHPWRSQGFTVEAERCVNGEILPVATIFLTGRECPWRCTMCDLWRFTTRSDTPSGAIAGQVAAARSALESEVPGIRSFKLYNAGSFFDPRAVPDHDYEGIAVALAGLAHVIVESHPGLVERGIDRLLRALRAAGDPPPTLEVAMGLETAHPGALEQLNKRMTVEMFETAAARLAARGVAVRAFLLIAPPFIDAESQEDWLVRSVDRAYAAGAAVVTLIPTRLGNGTMETLETAGLFAPPALATVERAAEVAHLRRPAQGRLFVDLWDFDRIAGCAACSDARRDRLHRINLWQRLEPPIVCSACAAGC